MFISILVLSFLVIVVINEQLDNYSTRCGHLGHWHQLTSGPVQQEVVILGKLGGFSAWKDTPAAFTIAWVFNQLIIIITPLRDALLSKKCSFFEHCSKGL